MYSKLYPEASSDGVDLSKPKDLTERLVLGNSTEHMHCTDLSWSLGPVNKSVLTILVKGTFAGPSSGE